MKTVLVTGSSGLIGSEVCTHFARELGYAVHGVDNNQRAVFFGPQGDTRWNQHRLEGELEGFVHHELDIRDRAGVRALLAELKPSAIVHAAAQPSHDRAAAIPFDDFDTNATGTLNLLEAARQECPESPFVHMSTNKVYGDAPNLIALRELETRWDYADPAYAHGIPESFTIDQSKHSLFGASKVASDVMVQEYGRYFGMPTCCLRGGCLTGPNHSGVELHGFLSYLVKCNLEGRQYTVFGYKGKQVRDNIHSLDVARFMAAFIATPRSGEVYNLGGGKDNSCSILEAFAITEGLTGQKQLHTYTDQNRAGDHICYYSDLRKMRAHYPGWDITKSLTKTIEEIVDALATPGRVTDAALPRLLYVGDVSVADTMAGEALLYRLLQFYPPEKLALICGVRPGMAALPGVVYHHWGPMFPSLLHSRVAEEYVLWRAWRYYEVPAAIERIATLFRAEAILSISHVSGWLAAWQLARNRRLPFHLIAHDDLVYSNRFPAWSRAWAARKFGEAYRDAASRFCISDAMEEIYRQRFGAPGNVMYPTYKGDGEAASLSPRAGHAATSLVFGYGGSINSASDMDQLIAFARAASARGHRLMVFSPQHQQLADRAAAAGVTIDTHAPIHSAELTTRFRAEADCLLLPQSMVEADRILVATAFPTKWSDYSMLGLPVIVWAPPGSSSERFVHAHPGCAELVTTTEPADLERALAAIESGPEHRRRLADTLLHVGRQAFSPHAAWEQFSTTIARPALAGASA